MNVMAVIVRALRGVRVNADKRDGTRVENATKSSAFKDTWETWRSWAAKPDSTLALADPISKSRSGKFLNRMNRM
jgi:hypothetical protein